MGIWRGAGGRMMDRMAARSAVRRPVATRFTRPPEPRQIGLITRGQQLVAGEFLFSGLRLRDRTTSIWTVAKTHPQVADEIHACLWLDDLAAFGTEAAHARARAWVLAWIDKHGAARGGEGWAVPVAARRLTRWIDHGDMILRRLDPREAERFMSSLGQQARFLARRAQALPRGPQRFEALAAAIHAGLALTGADGALPGLVKALTRDCDVMIDPQGALASRNPEALLTLLGQLISVREDLRTAGRDIPLPLEGAIARIAPVLRGLRHADGALPRFHGGGRGVAGRLDAALLAAGPRATPGAGPHMGYLRLAAGRTTLIADAARPPAAAANPEGHASTLAFEVTSGRRPVIVSSGSGVRFGPEWQAAARSTAGHSALSVGGASSSRVGGRSQAKLGTGGLTFRPKLVRGEVPSVGDAPGTERGLNLSHDGYRASHGLTHARQLRLTSDGRCLSGEDHLVCETQKDRATLDAARKLAGPGGLGFQIRFHLHPDVKPQIHDDGRLVEMRLPSGETWVLRQEGAERMALAPSAYLETGALSPRPTQQVVLTGRAMAYANRVRWTLAKAADTPDALRDLVMAEDPDLTG